LNAADRTIMAALSQVVNRAALVNMEGPAQVARS